MENKIDQSAWEIVQEAVDKGYLTVAAKRIQELSGVSLKEAIEIVKYMKQNSTSEEKTTLYNTAQIASGDELREYIYEAKRDPNNAIVCTSCRVCYPSRLEKCPGCGIKSGFTKRQNNTFRCSSCYKLISYKAESCPHCGNPTGIHVCPRCSSINTKVITGASKATSIFLWGVFAANKVVSKFECKDCGHKW